MKIYLKYVQQCLLLAVLLCGVTHAEDIDIFAGTTVASNGLPNVIFVLDNTSNWSRQSQQWPDGVDQGQSEVRAIKAALAPHVGKLNVGIMEYVTGGNNAANDSGYTRFHLQPLTATSLGADNSTDRNTVNGVLNTIFDNINEPDEKRDSSNAYGDLVWDFYNYLNGGQHSNSGTGTPSLADPKAYTTNYSLFNSPLGDTDACADTYMIFIGNNANGAVTVDDATNSNALKAAYIAAGTTAPDALAGSNTGTPLGMPGFSCTQVTTQGELISAEVPEIREDQSVTRTIPAEVGKTLGVSAACYRSTQVANCTTAERGRATGPCNVSPGLPAPVPTTGTCSCTVAVASPPGATPACVTSGPPANRTSRYRVVGNIASYPVTTIESVVIQEYQPAVYGPDVVTDVCEATDTVNTTTGRAYNFDDWAKYLKNYGVPLTVVKDGETYNERVKVKTFVIDVFNAQQSADLSSVWFSAANVGGGRYFQAKNEQQIVDSIQFAVGDILAVSSSFSAVTLPLNTTNSSQVQNKIYIGMFRPAPGKAPRWFGNLKRYRLATFFGKTELADVNLRQATNPLTGFATDCAESFWTSDTDRYWESLGIEPSPDSKCDDAIAADKQWSDLPDGPIVEKGGVAQATREGPAADDRKLYTVKSGAIAEIDADAGGDATALGGVNVLNYLRGDAPGVGELMAMDGADVLGLRPSIHGDVVHSRPLSVAYDEETVLLFYGSNDGLFRAVDANSGAEQWAFLAPEHFAKVKRLYDNAPLVLYEGAEQEVGETYLRKEYFFDGSTGQFVVYEDNVDPASSAVGELDFAYIYPTMRRGGRMLYAFDVTAPDSAPVLMWRKGCPNLADDSGCDTGFADIGQTWSTPVGIYVKDYNTGSPDDPKPLVIVGGGFDDCLNADQAAYPGACTSAKGKGIYLLDATTGAIVEYFATLAPVITDVVPVDIDQDRAIDFAYAADVAGNLYRISFANLVNDLADLTSVPPGSIVPRDEADWVIERIAELPDTQRRFYNSPSVGLYRGTVFVAIGTGDRERPLEANYPYDANVQNRFYVLADEPHTDYVAEQEAIAESETYTRRVVNLEGNTMYEVGTEQLVGEDDGWFLDLPDRGEQTANPAVVAGGQVFFNTFQPGGAGGGLCDLPLGIGTAYQLNLRDPQSTEGTQLEAPGFPVAPIIASVVVPVGCVAEPCEPVTTEDECEPPNPACSSERVIIGGCSNEGVCDIDPVPPPVRKRAYFTEDVDR